MSGKNDKPMGSKVELDKPGAGGRCLYWNNPGLAVLKRQLPGFRMQLAVNDHTILPRHTRDIEGSQ
ncbi:MAG TPA: hypothetical protein VL614_09295 [Acetobacteraceae bacterium]|nr:hypothetical protein [Acetobacteraceae bacterium]